MNLRCFFLGLFFCCAIIPGGFFPAAAQETFDPSAEGGAGGTNAAYQLSDEQVLKLVTLAKMLEHREFSVIANALRFPDAKIPAGRSDSANYRFLRTLGEYGLAKENVPPLRPGIPAEAQGAMTSYSYSSGADDVIADILKVAKPDQASKIDGYLAEAHRQ